MKVTEGRFCIFLWVLIWVFYLGRGLIRGEWAMYEKLFHLPLEHRMAAFMDDPDFYWFIHFCRQKLPEGSTFQLISPFRDDHHDMRRAYYLLYPLRSEDTGADYALVYRKGDLAVPGYVAVDAFRTLGSILKRKNSPG